MPSQHENQAPKKSLPPTSVNNGKKKGRSHYAYYTPTQRTSKRRLLDQADRSRNVVRSVRVMALLCRSAPLPSAVQDRPDRSDAAIHPTAWKECSTKSISSIARISPPIATPGLQPLRPMIPSITADHNSGVYCYYPHGQPTC